MENLDFQTTLKYNKNDVVRVQTRLLEMGKIAAAILDRNGFQYMLAFGAMLGAVRHQGFIPWDDDLDFFLFDDEYDAALDCLRRELPKDIVVHDRKSDPIYWKEWAMLRDTHTKCHAELFPDDNAFRYTGIGIDLCRLKKTPRANVKSDLKRANIEYLVRKYDAGVMPDAFYREKFMLWAKEYTSLIDERPATIDENDLVYYFVTILPLAEIKDIFPLKKYQFEDTEFWGPNNADALLNTSYGDYMQIPPYEKRKPHYDYVEFKE